MAKKCKSQESERPEASNGQSVLDAACRARAAACLARAWNERAGHDFRDDRVTARDVGPGHREVAVERIGLSHRSVGGRRHGAVTRRLAAWGIACITDGIGAAGNRDVSPGIGGLVTSFGLELLVYPAIYYLWRRKDLAQGPATVPQPEAEPGRA